MRTEGRRAVKVRWILLVIALFAIFPAALVDACKVVFHALLQIVANLSGVHV
jgi:hypothetical protein